MDSGDEGDATGGEGAATGDEGAATGDEGDNTGGDSSSFNMWAWWGFLIPLTVDTAEELQAE